MIAQKLQDDVVYLLKTCQFRLLCDRFFSDNFYWVIKGSSILSGEYYDKNVFFEKVIGRLSRIVESNWRMHILATYMDGNVLIVEMRGEVKAKNGADYNNDYCWILHFQNDKVIKLTAYYDSLLVNTTLAENEH